MFYRKAVISPLMSCFLLLLINQCLSAETGSSQRDGTLVVVGQVIGGIMGEGIGFFIGAFSLWYAETLIIGDSDFSPGLILGGMLGGTFGCAGGTYAVGELAGSGGGTFKETLKWTVYTFPLGVPFIGATIGYQRSKRKEPPGISFYDGRLELIPPMMVIQSSQLSHHQRERDYLVRLVNVRF